MRIVSNAEMKKIEELTQKEFLLSEQLMIENVGTMGALKIIEQYPQFSKEKEILFLIGKGNNGADAISIARKLANRGYKCRAFFFFSKEERKESLAQEIDRAVAFGVTTALIDSAEHLVSYINQVNPGMVIDGLFGSGVQLPLSNFMYDVIDVVNDFQVPTISIDIPSGVEGDTGLIQGNAIEADHTLIVGFAKQGLYIKDGAKHAGKLAILDIGFPYDLNFEGNKFLLRPEHMISLMEKRDKFADKKIFGHALVLAGSHGLTGAASLASQAALRSGSGLVTVATWEPQYQEMIARLIPEVMTGYVPLDIAKWDRLIRDLNKYSSIVIGPGMARSSRSRRLVLEILNNFDGPVVIDADAINVLNFEQDAQAFRMRNAPTILTPHFGEFARFTNTDINEVEKRPVECLLKLIENINCTVVLKGPCTFVGCSDGNVLFNYLPNDGMATGGAGDVLAGILGGLLGQEVSIKDQKSLLQRYETVNKTVALAIYLHSVAGKIAAKNAGVRSMSASSIINSLDSAFNSLDMDMDRVSKGL